MEKKVIVWDLDNTLYRETPEFHKLQDELMALVAIEDLGVNLDFEEAKKRVAESYKIYRDGGEYFIQEYGISAKDMFELYHKRKQENLRHIYPYDSFLEKLQSIKCEQYVFSVNPVETSEKMLEHLGLYEFFKGNIYSVAQFGCYKKNENLDVYTQLCKKIGANPENVIFIDDSYSYLEFAKKAGLRTVRLCHGKPNDCGVEYIDHAVDNIEECISFLKNEFCS